MTRTPAAEVCGGRPFEESIENVEDGLGNVQLDEGEGFRIPVIDFDGKHEDVVKAVAEACRQWGFFQAINHGIPIRSTQGAMKVSREFFDLPYEDKASCNNLANKFPNQSHPANNFITDTGGDLKHVLGGSADWRNTLRLNCCLLKQYNAWPEKPSSFKDVMQEYMEHVLKFTLDVLDIISEGLGLKDSQILQKKFGTAPRHNLALNYYPPFHKPDLVRGLPAHSDFGGIMALLQDSVGLEICKDKEVDLF